MKNDCWFQISLSRVETRIGTVLTFKTCGYCSVASRPHYIRSSLWDLPQTLVRLVSSLPPIYWGDLLAVHPSRLPTCSSSFILLSIFLLCPDTIQYCKRFCLWIKISDVYGGLGGWGLGGRAEISSRDNFVVPVTNWRKSTDELHDLFAATMDWEVLYGTRFKNLAVGC